MDDKIIEKKESPYQGPSVSFCDALTCKYSDEAFGDVCDAIELAPRQRALILKQKDHTLRTSLHLDACNVSHAGEDLHIKNLCPNLEKLDLSSNLLTSWQQIFLIIGQLNKLAFLNLSHNAIQRDVSDVALRRMAEAAGPLPDLKKLVMNGTKVPFSIVCLLLDFFPSLDELYVGLNGYSEISEVRGPFHSVTGLHLSQNNIDAWSSVETLAETFPNLRSLVLYGNPLTSISGRQPTGFKHLQRLSVSETNLNDWDSIDAVSGYSTVIDFRALKIPLLEAFAPDVARGFLIARLPRVSLLNGSTVGEEERESAERAFIRQFMDSPSKPARYYELIGVYGTLDRLAHVDLTPKETASVTFEGDGIKSRIITVDLHQTVSDFRRAIAKMTQLKMSQFRLLYHDVGFEAIGPQEIRHSAVLRMMSLRLKDGDRIRLQRLDISPTSSP